MCQFNVIQNSTTCTVRKLPWYLHETGQAIELQVNRDTCGKCKGVTTERHDEDAPVWFNNTHPALQVCMNPRQQFTKLLIYSVQ